jgi:hypothetical protein
MAEILERRRCKSCGTEPSPGADVIASANNISPEELEMSTILIIILLIVLLGGGGGYYGYRSYGGAGLGGALGLVLVVLLVIWLAGGLAVHPV